MKEILLFNKALNVKNVSFYEVNNIANQKGYLVHPDCCNDRVLTWLNTLPINYNSTFYKSWHTVIGKSRFELFIDQAMHYMSTYGTCYNGEVYIPNENPTIVAFNDYKIILPITIEEISLKIQGMFNSGIALKQETIEDCLSLAKEFNISLNYTSIRNKEVLMHLYKELDTLPTKPEEMVRFLVFLYTGKTLLIKDKKTIAIIKENPKQISELIKIFGIEKLSEVFYRFKQLFLAMKKNNESVINTLRRLAVKNHKPYQSSYFEQILSGKSDLSKLEENLKHLNNFKKVLLLQTINIRKTDVNIQPIIVRNGKLWVNEANKSQDKNYYSLAYYMIYISLIDSLSKKKCKIKLHLLNKSSTTNK